MIRKVPKTREEVKLEGEEREWIRNYKAVGRGSHIGGMPGGKRRLGVKGGL